MDLLNFWKLKKYRRRHDAPTVITKTSFQKERFVKSKNKNDLECNIKVECDLCHNGYQIPIEYTDKHGKVYLYDEIKAKITNPDPKKLMQRIYGIR